jgi:hypothetical protein
MAVRRVGLPIALAALQAVAAPSVARPDVGRHTVQFCVATSSAPPGCGQAQADVRADGSLRVRIDDVVYNIRLHSSQVEIVVMHNVVQIDELVAPYEWVGNTLQFSDDERHSRYEIRFPQRKR